MRFEGRRADFDDVEPDAQPSVIFPCNRRAMGPLLENDHKPYLCNEKRRVRAARGLPKYENLNAEFNDWDRDAI